MEYLLLLQQKLYSHGDDFVFSASIVAYGSQLV